MSRYNILKLVDHFHRRGLYRSIFLRYIYYRLLVHECFNKCIRLFKFFQYISLILILVLAQYNGRGTRSETILTRINGSGPKHKRCCLSSSSYGPFPWYRRLFHSVWFQVWTSSSCIQLLNIEMFDPFWYWLKTEGWHIKWDGEE